LRSRSGGSSVGVGPEGFAPEEPEQAERQAPEPKVVVRRGHLRFGPVVDHPGAMQAAAENDRLARRRATQRATEGNSLGGSLDKMELSAYLISTAITTNKIIAAVVVLVVIVAAVFFFMRRRTA
jgi:hypothetical protein